MMSVGGSSGRWTKDTRRGSGTAALDKPESVSLYEAQVEIERDLH